MLLRDRQEFRPAVNSTGASHDDGRTEISGRERSEKVERPKDIRLVKTGVVVSADERGAMKDMRRADLENGPAKELLVQHATGSVYGRSPRGGTATDAVYAGTVSGEVFREVTADET